MRDGQGMYVKSLSIYIKNTQKLHYLLWELVLVQMFWYTSLSQSSFIEASDGALLLVFQLLKMPQGLRAT